MSSLFRNILQQVTQEKLEELKVRKDLSSNYFNPILTKIADPSITPRDALQVLYTAIKDYPLQDIVDSTLLENLKYVLQNNQDDPSISSQLMVNWVDKVKQEILFSLRQCDYSYLYGSLLSEWLEAEDRKAEAPSPDASNSTEESELKKKTATNAIKTLIFNQPKIDGLGEKFKSALSGELFNFEGNVEGQNILKAIQQETKDYFDVDKFVVSSYDVQCCIRGLRTGDLLSLDKKTALKELSVNSEALSEVASLLTNRLKNLGRWNWPSSTETVEVRRGLAGEYKPYLNEDIITALFLQYVGVQWASYFKRQFLTLYRSKVWTKAFCLPESIEAKRNSFYERTFLSTLPDSMALQENKLQDEYAKIEADDVASDYVPQSALFTSSSGIGAQFPGSGSAGQLYPEAGGSQYPGPGGSQYPGAPGSIYPVGGGSQYPGAGGPSYGPGGPGSYYPYRGPYRNNNYEKTFPTSTSNIDFKQEFLHILSTEIRLNQVIHPEKPFVVVQANLESFGPSIVHDAVLTTLEFLGVSEKWIGFFKKFLQPKVKFAADEEASTVVRGAPTSHVLSSLFGEMLLFVLDFYVNQKCDGMRIYRIADEFWFWSDETKNITEAWRIINGYGGFVGLKIHKNQSGSVSVCSEEMLATAGVSKDTPISGPSPLPRKSIHWGYLKLHSNGTFIIDQKAIEKFLEEMQDLLNKSTCVLEWINIFNKYLEFFVRNFGKCALVSGKQHLDQIIAALRIIYVGLFGSEDGNPVEEIKSRFDILKSADIVDVWAYWPLERGGLGLVNPFIGIIALREALVDNNDEDNFTKLPLKDKDLWEEMKENYERKYGSYTRGSYPGGTLLEKLPTWTEYIQKRETELSHWYFRYLHLLDRPAPKTPTVSDKFWKLDAPIPQEEFEKNYMMWLFTYYETQLILHFGSVKFINSKLLPMSMIATIQKTKVQH